MHVEIYSDTACQIESDADTGAITECARDKFEHGEATIMHSNHLLRLHESVLLLRCRHWRCHGNRDRGFCGAALLIKTLHIAAGGQGR